MRFPRVAVGLLALFLGVWSCAPVGEGNEAATASQDPPTLVLNITSSGEEDPHAVTMALQLAGHSLDAGRATVLFFNVKGAGTPTADFPDSLAFGDRPIKELLAEALDRGAEVHVCPHCMSALGVEAADLIPGARVTDSDALFAHLGEGTVVFTY